MTSALFLSRLRTKKSRSIMGSSQVPKRGRNASVKRMISTPTKHSKTISASTSTPSIPNIAVTSPMVKKEPQSSHIAGTGPIVKKEPQSSQDVGLNKVASESTQPSQSMSATSTPTPKKLKICLRDTSIPPRELWFLINPNTKMSRLFEVWNKVRKDSSGQRPDSWKFLYDGKRLSGDDTCEEVSLIFALACALLIMRRERLRTGIPSMSSSSKLEAVMHFISEKKAMHFQLR